MASAEQTESCGGHNAGNLGVQPGYSLDHGPRGGEIVEASHVEFIALTGLVFLCVSWLISSIQSSPWFAEYGGLAAPLVIVMALAWLGHKPLFQ